MEFAKSAATKLEKIEKLEQLRLIENRSMIDVLTVTQPTLGIDTREDYDKFLALIAERRL
jgi:3-deoxy-manno-octulosonate cytidylyltransferase (CMP-KDO synthetase)